MPRFQPSFRVRPQAGRKHKRPAGFASRQDDRDLSPTALLNCRRLWFDVGVTLRLQYSQLRHTRRYYIRFGYIIQIIFRIDFASFERVGAHLELDALDVQDPEPLPPGHPLWRARNIIITPHISAGSDTQMQRFWLVVRENLRRYTHGERMLNVVDTRRGY